MSARPVLAIALGAAAVVLAPPPAIGQDGGAPLQQPVVGPEVNVSSTGYGTTPIITGWGATCSDTRCMVTWNSYNNGHAMPVDSEGRPVRQAALMLDGFVGGQRSSVFLGDDFVIASRVGGDMTLVRVSADGVPNAKVTLALTSANVSDFTMAWNGSRLLVFYRDQIGPSSSNPYTMVLDGNLATVVAPAPFTPDPGVPELLVRTGNEFVLLGAAQAWALNGAGQIVLGPVAMPPQAGTGFGAISAGGVPVLLSAFPAMLIRLGADLRPSTMAPPPSGGGALAWNGTHILIVSSDSATSNLNTRRYNLDLGAADATATSIPASLNSYPFAAGRGSEFMLFVAEIGYVPGQYGIVARPLNAGGRPRTTTDTLVSVAALRHWLPFLVAQPSGYLAFAAQGEMEVGVMPLGSDGRPVADRPATGLVTGRTPQPVALGTSPAGGIAVAGMFGEFRTAAMRFDGVGHVLDNPPLETRVEARYRGGIVWNGSSYFLLAGDRTATVGADGSIGSFLNYFFPRGSTLSAVDIMGTTPLCAFIDYRPELNDIGLAAMRFDQAGMPIDAQPITLTPVPAGTATATGVSLAHDGTRYLAAMDPAVLEANGALTSEVRVLRIGTNAQAADASSTLLRRATGAPPTVSGAAPIPAISNPTAVYDGRMYWVVWREQGLWVRRVGTDARVLDSQPIRLLDEPFEEFALASQGSGALLLAYSRLDEAPDVQSVRLKARLITTGDTTGAGGAGGRGGAGGGGGAGGVSGRGGASGATGGGGGSGTGGRGGAGGATGAATRGGASGAAGSGAAGAAAGGGASGSGAAVGGGGTTGVGGAGGGAAGGGAGGATSGSSGSSGAAGTSGSGGASGGSGTAGTGGAAGTSGAAGASGGSGGVGGATSGSSGCGCETAAANDHSAVFALWLLVAAGLKGRRSKRRAVRAPRAGAR